ncbi:glycerol-3-phosphate acyltransferase 1, mitochondrial-like [Liolophura sinensis]|uniref:glycerol-3-phosphate acyltransferase 1, mitochondrial-like n=1 Tax=Liolophura sinensis TaxID=3198878 RepID=UPI0031593CA8
MTRPFMGQCCQCMPTCRKSLLTSSCSQMGLRNVLNIQHELRNRGPLAKIFSHSAYLLQRRTFYKYTNVSVAVLASSRVQGAVHQPTSLTQVVEDMEDDETSSREEKKALCKREKKAKSMLNNMRAHVSSLLVSFTGWFLLKFLSLMTSSIQVHKGQMQLVKKATEKSVPMIYVPLHRSHLDYILVTFILWHYDIKAPHIAAGDNLNIPVFSCLMRGLGAFFIRRRLDKQKGKKDILYRSILQSYVEELLRNGEGIEFFIEGGRSRTGKACSPKAGLLSVIVDAYKSEIIEDAFIVPVTINYEKLLDGNFNNELMGKRKTKETFWGAVRGIVRVVNGNFGHVRIGFCQPFSLKEFMVSQACQSSRAALESVTEPSPVSPSHSEDCAQDSPPDGFRSRHGSFSSLLGSEVVNSDQKEVVHNLGRHIVYDAAHSTALMSTNLLSFLLLTKHREGTSLVTLINSFAWLQDDLSIRKRDVGFSGSLDDIVNHALGLLGDELANPRLDKNGNLVIKPNLSLPHVLELSYYSNAVISPYLLESVIVNSVFAALDTGLSTMTKNISEDDISTSREKILIIATELCKLFQNEFIFIPSCEELHHMLAQTLEELVTSEVLHKEETKILGAYTEEDKKWAKNFGESFSWQSQDSDEENWPPQDYLISVNVEDSDVIERLSFLQSILGPYIEGYWTTALTITKLREKEMAEDDFFKLLHNSAMERVNKELTTYAESSSMEILKNAMKTFQELKLIDCYFAGNLKMVELHDHYLVEEKLQDLLDLLESLRE